MRPFTDTDFPLVALGRRVHCKWGGVPVCEAQDEETAQEIAKRLNRDNQVYPDDADT